jgi:hypothetical protein
VEQQKTFSEFETSPMWFGSRDLKVGCIRFAGRVVRGFEDPCGVLMVVVIRRKPEERKENE